MRYSSSVLALVLGLGIYAVGPVITKFGPFAAVSAHAEKGHSGGDGGSAGSDGSDNDNDGQDHENDGNDDNEDDHAQGSDDGPNHDANDDSADDQTGNSGSSVFALPALTATKSGCFHDCNDH